MAKANKKAIADRIFKEGLGIPFIEQVTRRKIARDIQTKRKERRRIETCSLKLSGILKLPNVKHKLKNEKRERQIQKGKEVAKKWQMEYQGNC